MTLTLRARFLFWLLAHTAATYVVMGFGLYLLGLELREDHPDDFPHEREELVIIYVAMLGALPIVVGGAWLVTGRLLRPLRSMLSVADQIGAGRLERRLETPVADDELGHLARTLNRAFDNYHRLLGRLDRFSLDAAHQLRNPLGSMRTQAEVCLRQPRSREEYVETLGRILEEARRLGHTVDQLLLLARLARDLPEEAFESLDLAVLVDGLAQTLRPVFEDRGLALEVQLPAGGAPMRGAPRLLEQAVANLLDNSLRLTPSGGRVQVELTPHDAGGWRLRIADSGQGLEGMLTPGPLDPDRPAPVSPAREGTGLGLSIAGNIVLAHGGRVGVSVSELGGACFTIDLPGGFPGGPADPPEASAPRGG